MAANETEQGKFAWGTTAAEPVEGGQAGQAAGEVERASVAPRSKARGRARKAAAAAVVARPRPATPPTLPPDNELWDVRAAARFLRRSVSWVYHRAEDGTLPVRRLGGWGLRFIPTEMRTWVETGEVAKRR